MTAAALLNGYAATGVIADKAYDNNSLRRLIADAATKGHPGARVTWVIDCGADAGTALGALRIGWKKLRFSGPDSLREKLTDIAAQRDAAVTGVATGETVLDLLEHHDPAATCRDVLAETKG